MITKVSGKLLTLSNDVLTLEVGAFEYEVLIPEFTRLQLQSQLGHAISLHTIEYLEGNAMQGRLIPRLVGFFSEIERDFFELFCSVDGVGVKKALRAMVRPVREVAIAIEEQDVKSLATLPGIGPATAERIVAKLRRKVPQFALMVARDMPYAAMVENDVVAEAFRALRTLGHSEADARKLLDTVLGGKKKFDDVQDVLQAIYQKNREGG
ncbi:MAG: Holliday junction DNA helicase RuvA [Pirellulales bacterium]|nr:Holliday junction DNA helicase RuvA [Pirellulales bacterium]